ncbi:SRPBCC family protein [Bradyrhizobium sp. U87765 SZCCT0131]|uniref:SRPBCC family protein n=1 Tax=unclassified Bradyrhizobium TaxID=2631580 RepID=UPI001BAD01E9|nr:MULTISPECIES: SRPBCC family protein [unclassified Bradyrhizobium]MBR1218077.1 SRPBCC family protein [Bradyrhizobium sp. U87765 SZCCT0131]MBR1260977.1 SRPBCC family protein [Bradyrhizobium sp. U87765 SZCCT0134]MBR1303575.1 SRPBCC family protein [Bradyrhizobium sp. U87765 SZCCT0110]MBR1319181.1 SRPBCC family protein [Bradyrhizobium sp. U87765 SZCCT0109]MBR1347506.1 SRPBCC family protein [Bradyrhizobium sp. U87765 SZCCT0048]
MTILATIAVAIAILLALFLIYAASRPNTFAISRSTSIAAPAARIQSMIDDFRQWPRWSPYETKDPDMKRTYSGAASGRGAVYAWEGDKNVGSGRMEILDTSPEKVAIKLDFISPFEAHNVAEFSFAPRGESTTVTWAMHGPVPYIGKIMHLFINMDRMVGDDFEAGLAKLKVACER